MIREPYELVFQNWDRILQAAHEDGDKTTINHVDLFRQFLEAELPSTWGKMTELKSKLCDKIAFDDLWLLYNTGTTVFAKDDGGWRAYKVERTESRSRLSCDSMFVHCLYLDWEASGQWLTPQHEIFSIQPYTSERSIADLQLVPKWYFQDPQCLEDELFERGKSFWEHSSKVNFKEYTGNIWPHSLQHVSIAHEFPTISYSYLTSDDHMTGSSQCDN